MEFLKSVFVKALQNNMPEVWEGHGFINVYAVK